MGNGQWALGMGRIIFIPASLTAAFLILIAHCPLPFALCPMPIAPTIDIPAKV